MQKFRILINGENLLVESEGVRMKMGFYTNAFVEAFTEKDAEARALDIIREDPDLANIRLNSDDDALQLSIEECCEIESFDGHRVPRDSFMLYPMIPGHSADES